MFSLISRLMKSPNIVASSVGTSRYRVTNKRKEANRLGCLSVLKVFISSSGKPHYH